MTDPPARPAAAPGGGAQHEQPPPWLTLGDGLVFPRVGLGTWQVPDDEVEQVVDRALELGYRSFDTAASYHNERGIGAAIRASGVARDHIRVTTKLWNSDHGAERARRACETSIERLGLDRVDLYLIHWPLPMRGRFVETWRTLAQLRAEGLVRAIGVSNFTEAHIRTLIDECGVVPAVNQVELHPLCQQTGLREFHARHGIVTQAWSPLGSGQGMVDLPLIRELAEACARTPAQVLIRWQLQSGHLVVPKTRNPERLAENLRVFDFSLDARAMAAIGGLDTGRRNGPDPDAFDYG